jgi:hypothetical protein
VALDFRGLNPLYGQIRLDGSGVDDEERGLEMVHRSFIDAFVDLVVLLSSPVSARRGR